MSQVKEKSHLWAPEACDQANVHYQVPQRQGAMRGDAART